MFGYIMGCQDHCFGQGFIGLLAGFHTFCGRKRTPSSKNVLLSILKWMSIKSIVCRSLVQLIRGYKWTFSKTWAESMPDMPYLFNKPIHSSTNKLPFDVCLGCLPNSPLDFILEQQDQQEGLCTQVGKVHKFIERIRGNPCHKVRAQLGKTQLKSKPSVMNVYLEHNLNHKPFFNKWQFCM